jgi:hypothetical protein
VKKRHREEDIQRLREEDDKRRRVIKIMWLSEER